MCSLVAKLRIVAFVSLLFAAVILPASAAYRAPAWSRSGMAATPHREATAAAVEMLEAGGNAVDAAVAAAFALAVVEQYHSGLGGGEFALVYNAATGEVNALDARECAPAAAKRDMYLNPETGEPFPEKSWRGGLAVGVPGSVAGRVELVRRNGRLPLRKVVIPAIRLARDGFRVDRILADRLQRYRDRLAEMPGSNEIFFVGGEPLQRGAVLKQPQLAAALERIGQDGGEAFYRGDDATAIVNACRDAGGIITAQDLASYEVKWRRPVSFDYRGLTVYSMPPPSSGGLCLALIMNILEGFPLEYIGPGGAESLHLLASSFEPAFADRAAWLGDPDYAPQPSGMASQEYADEVRARIDRRRRVPVESPGDPWPYGDGGNTSHISVIDRDGNMCSITTSVNTSFGSLVFVPDLGIFLNSTMDDFNTAPEGANKWDLPGGEVNSVAPGKRPLSSMSPTLVLKGGEPWLALGSVGGPRIITSVAQMLVNIVDFKMNLQAAVDAPRIHMQWRPDKLYIEDETAPETADKLRAMGWDVKRNGHWSLSQAVMFNRSDGVFYGASDARGVGAAAGPDSR